MSSNTQATTITICALCNSRDLSTYKCENCDYTSGRHDAYDIPADAYDSTSYRVKDFSTAWQTKNSNPRVSRW